MANKRVQAAREPCDDCGAICAVIPTSSRWLFALRCRCGNSRTLAWATREPAPDFTEEAAMVCQHVSERVVNCGTYQATLREPCVALAQAPSVFCVVHRTEVPVVKVRRPRRDRTRDVLPWSPEDEDVFAAHRAGRRAVGAFAPS